VGLIGTLVITRFLSPEVMGEVGVAVVAVLTAQFVSDLAFGQYIVVKSKDDPGAVFHAFVYNLLTLALAAITLLLLAEPIGDFLGAKEMTRYLPVMVLSLVFERLARIPESVALRDLHFKLFAAASAVSELTYVGVSLSMAAAGFGGDSIVWANVAQYGLRFVWLGLAIDRSLWFHPVKITWRQTKEMLGFGVPLAVGNAAHFASNAWDRLIVTGLFGSAVHGLYALGKSLSAVPADNVGDAVSDVLMPSFVRMTPEEARIAVVRASHFVAIIVYPLAAGLAVVSPTLVQALFTPEWYGIAMPLTILASVSLIDPMGDTMTSYLKARHMPWAVMFIQISFLGVILAATFVLGYYFGLYGACFGVGVGMFYRAMCALYVAHRLDHVSVLDMMVGLIRTALASGLMALAVLGVREVLTGKLDNIFLALGIEIVVGGIAFVPAAFLVAGPIARDVIAWVRKRRAGGDEDEDEGGEDEGSEDETVPAL
jgi:PST family polysaccharide transporter